MDAIERIEIAVRAIVVNSISEKNGSHWYLKRSVFGVACGHEALLEDIKKQIRHYEPTNRDIHIRHYYDKYLYPEMPPCWMVFESISFGTVSKIYKNLCPSEFMPIAKYFGLSHPVLASWLHSISYVRNICAHHSRLWNIECRVKPMEANSFRIYMTPNNRLYAQLVIMNIILRKISPGNSWVEKLKTLCSEHSEIPIAEMGFPDGWAEKGIWKS
jgi:abortive infection bacteriophage resistance protein